MQKFTFFVLKRTVWIALVSWRLGLFNHQISRWFSLVSSEHRQDSLHSGGQSSFWHAQCRWQHHAFLGENLEDTLGLLIDESRDMLDTTKSSQSADSRMLSRKTFQWCLAPPFPSLLPPLPHSVILSSFLVFEIEWWCLNLFKTLHSWLQILFYKFC